MHNVAIKLWLNFGYYIFDIIIFTRINRGIGNQICVPNTDPLLLLPTP